MLFNKNKLHLVDFSNQSKFLKKLGIVERVQSAKNYMEKKQQNTLEIAVSRLLSPSQMGCLFKVLVISNKHNINFKYDI